MAHIKIKKGLNIPVTGEPTGSVQELKLSGEATKGKKPSQISLNLNPFEGIRFKLLAKVGDVVKLGQPLVEDKLSEGRVWVSPASGVVSEVRRGLKRRLIDIVIDVAESEELFDIGPLNASSATREQLIDKLKEGGIFANIRKRPFNLLADPTKLPRSIIVKAIESAPYTPPAHMQVDGHEGDFQVGLSALSKLTDGAVHLIYSKDCQCEAFTQAKDVKRHTAEGPHPIGTFSIFVHELDPIVSVDDVVWTLNVHDVVGIGHLLRTGHHYIERVVSIAGPGILPERTGYFKVREGTPIKSLISNRVKEGAIRYVSGDPLMGHKVDSDDFLGYYDYAFCAIPESVEREFLHFFRLGLDKYSYSGAYVSGHLNPSTHKYDFTTSLHGEPRAFIDPTLYDEVMPLPVPTMQLCKAVMAEDFDLAEELGLLEVDGEDFALANFVCPSKVEMVDIIKNGLRAHATEVLE